MSDAPAPRARRPWGQAIATILTFLILGPPIGGLVFGVGVFLFMNQGDTPVYGWLDRVFIGVYAALVAVPFSYVIGGIQSGLTGLAVAMSGWITGRTPLWPALVAGATTFAGMLLWGWPTEDGLGALLLLVHLVPTVLCWLIARSYWPATRPQVPTQAPSPEAHGSP